MIRKHARAAVAALALFGVACPAARAAIIEFNLDGKAGPGLLPGNETHTINGTPGTGGEIGAGIFFDDVSKQLTINVGWGSGNGFTDLTGTATAAHIHGPTANPAPAGFNDAAGVAIGLDGLPGWNPSATNGSIVGTLTLNPTQEQLLFEERYYINVHTTQNSAGEIRGHLVIIPEPATAGLLMGGATLLLARRRRT